MSSFSGTVGDETFTGGAGDDTGWGAGGNDSLGGAGGSDTLAGGTGADTVAGGDGDDFIFSADPSPTFNLPYYNNPFVLPVLDTGTEVDILRGGDGSDRIFAGYGDSVDGGDSDVHGDYLYISFQGAPTGVTVDFRLATQTIGGGVITGIENVSYVQGSQFDDNINVDGNANGYTDFTLVSGMGGNDTLTAGYYTGNLFGDDGDDVVDGRNSQYLQLVSGGAGNDTLYTNSNTVASADGGAGDDTIFSHGLTHGGAGNDTIAMQETLYADRVFGDEGDDNISAANNGNFIAGGSGADTLAGAAGADTLSSADVVAGFTTPADDAGLEHDQLSGGFGDDALAIGYGDAADGGVGTDTLRLSLAGLGAGVDFDTAGIVSGQPFTLGGGVIQNIETLLSVRGTEFADTLRLATQDTQLTVNAGAGDDVIISHNSSVSVLGGDGNDRFVSGPAADTFDGGAGVDTADYSAATAGVGVDLLAGSGGGGDSLTAVENVIGTAFNDTIAGDSGNNRLDGAAGIDTLSYANASSGVQIELDQQGILQVTGGAGTDTFVNFENVTGSAFDDSIRGNDGDNVLDGGAGVDGVFYTFAAGGVTVSLALQGQAQVTGGSGTDTLFNFENLYGSHHNDTLTGDAHDNLMSGTFGDDRLDGGAGVDTVTFSAFVGVNVSLALQGQGQQVNGGVETLFNFENLTGSGGNDTLSGDPGDNVLDGLGDVLQDTRSGGDTVSYAAAGAGVTVSLALQGQAQVTGGDGTDNLLNFENLTGSAFNDTLGAVSNDSGFSGGLGSSLNGGAGIDTITYAAATSGVTVSLALQGNGHFQATAAGNRDTLLNFENLTGSAFNDTLAGDAGPNVLDGGAGVDRVTYAASATGVNISLALQGQPQPFNASGDTLLNFEDLTGSAFNDTLAGDSGANALDGGAGVDTVSYISAGAAVNVSLALQGQAQATGGGGVDTLSNFEDLTGSAFNDTLAGSLADNALDGGAGLDTITYAAASAGVNVSLALQGQGQATGGAGVDALSNFENLTGSAFNDTLAGDAGANALNGGAGLDTVSYAASSMGVNVSLALQGQGQATAGAGVDTLSGFENLTGSAFSDTLAGDAGANTLDGGAGSDTASYASAAAGVSVSLVLQGQAQFTIGSGFDTLLNFENLTGSAFNDTLTGDANANTIVAADGNDLFRGGAGDDVLEGGAGVDTALFSGVRAGLSVVHGNGAYHVMDISSGSPEGSDTIFNTEYLSFAGTTMSVERALLNTNAAVGDFDGDGHADILFRNQASGVSVVWQMNGAHNTGLGGVTDATAPLGYSLMGTGDFNGDGKADLLWRNDASGGTVVWDQSGAHLVGAGLTSAQVGNDWYVAGIADFSGDGKADLLWRNLDSGVTVIWNMNGATVTGAVSTDAFAPPGWSVAGTGDFNGDAHADILWRNDTDGSTLIWEQNNGQLVLAGFTSAYAPLPWVVAGVADFNGDGKADLLWRNVQTNQTAVWTMGGTQLTGGGLTDATGPAGWSIVGTGDFDGDGKADILWRNDLTQQTDIWTMNGAHVIAGALTDTFAPSGWVFT